MSEHYNITFVYNGIRITKSQDSNVMVEVFSEDGTSLIQLVEVGSYYVVFSNIWDRTEVGHIRVSSIQHEKAPDGRIINSLVVDSEIHETSLNFESGVGSLLIRFSNNQLGDNINFQSYVLEFLRERMDYFSNIVIHLKMYELCMYTFSEFEPIPINNTETGGLESLILSGGKCILRDLSEDINDDSFDVYIGIGLMESKDFVHPQGINVLNQLNMPYQPYSRLKLENYYEPIEHDKKYVCIAPYGTMKAKMWMSYDCQTNKWQSVVDYLTELGYDVWWISKEECNLNNVVNLSGDYEIEDRVRQLLGCEFFVGVASGLSWLANACGIHVFRINSWSWGWTEFQENTTIIENNNAGCRGCFNDGSLDKGNFYHDYCPRDMDFICSKSIPSSQVIEQIDKYNKMGDGG